MSFQTRWRITGTLIAQTPLHIGAGTTTQHENLTVEDKAVKVTAVALDGQGLPYIPGSTLKGNLRAWLQTRVKDTNLINSVFGTGVEEDKDQSEGGKAEFWNVFLANTLTPRYKPSHWHSERKVGVEVGVTIDRVTRTAREQKLFHREIVPPGIIFKVRLTGKGLTEAEVALLLAGLNGFNDEQQPLSLGSDNAQNKGQMKWQLQSIEQLDQAATQKWLDKGAEEMWDSALQPLNQTEQNRLLQLCNTLINEQSNQPRLQLHFRLTFDSPFLVNDPSLFVKGETPNHQPRRDHRGNAVLPSTSLRGAIRAQAERIIRTLEGNACFIDDQKLACDPIEQYQQVDTLCLACQLFGGTGWRSPIQISDFTLVEQESELTQEFVAIDRFTGGGAEHLKFNAQSIYKPTFEGRWTIDLPRIKPWGLGLLALVIRDFIDGDITFGYGAAKGYGHGYAQLQDWNINALPDVEQYPAWQAFAVDIETVQQQSPELNQLINRLVKDFQDICNQKV